MDTRISNVLHSLWGYFAGMRNGISELQECLEVGNTVTCENDPINLSQVNRNTEILRSPKRIIEDAIHCLKQQGIDVCVRREGRVEVIRVLLHSEESSENVTKVSFASTDSPSENAGNYGYIAGVKHGYAGHNRENVFVENSGFGADYLDSQLGDQIKTYHDSQLVSNSTFELDNSSLESPVTIFRVKCPSFSRHHSQDQNQHEEQSVLISREPIYSEELAESECHPSKVSQVYDYATKKDAAEKHQNNNKLMNQRQKEINNLDVTFSVPETVPTYSCSQVLKTPRLSQPVDEIQNESNISGRDINLQSTVIEGNEVESDLQCENYRRSEALINGVKPPMKISSHNIIPNPVEVPTRSFRKRKAKRCICCTPEPSSQYSPCLYF